MSSVARVRRPVRSGVVSSVGRLRGGAPAGIADVQRSRILSAMFDLACERGVGDVSVAHVVERSGVSRRTFYDVFDSCEDCFLAAFEDALAHASERVVAVYRSRESWRELVRTALVALLSFFDEEPLVGHVLIVESLVGGPRVLQRRREAVAAVIAAIDQGRAEDGVQPCSELTAEGIVGGAIAVIHERLVQPESGSLVQLAGPLMGMIVLPYLGAAAARRELERAAPIPMSAAERERLPLLSDPFKEAGMRLTYRTVRVLVGSAEHPGASNSTLARAAGIKDQGQVSKLLGRLERAGLISNAGCAPGSGGPNAWTLTPRGDHVVNSIRAHTREPR